jgi:peroxiredoxin
VLGVSLDDNGAKWKEAVTKDGMPWMQVSDLKGWKNAAARQYGIQAIPLNFLVDPNGVIIARDLRGTALDKKLAEVLGEPSASTAQPSLEELRAAAEANPDSLPAQEKYIAAFQKQNLNSGYTNLDSIMGALRTQYDAWLKRYPNSAVLNFAIGHALAGAELPDAKPYLLKAVALDPKRAVAYSDLAVDAERWGDFNASDAYLKKAMEAEPTSPDYASSYAFAMERTDPAKYRQLSLQVANQFPESERGAQMLYWLAYRSTDEADKASLYRQLKEKFPPTKFDWSASAMLNYFDLLLTQSPEQALALAREMSAISKEDDDYSKKQWDNNLRIAEHIVRANKAIEDHRGADAVSAMSDLTPSRYSGAKETVCMVKARAEDAAGNTQAAFDSLLVFYAKEPSDEVRTAMLKYARRLGKNEAWLNTRVQRQRDTAARDAPVFKLYAYKTGDSVSLKDYRGKVVLLTFWFPGCGPCRGEFPHFQEVLNKFKEKDVAYVGINVVLEQDPYVVPFISTSGYTFTPLRDHDKWAQKAYKVRGEDFIQKLILKHPVRTTVKGRVRYMVCNDHECLPPSTKEFDVALPQ